MKKLLLIVFTGVFLPLVTFSQVHNVYIGNGSASLSLSSAPDPHAVGFNDRYLNTEWKNGSIVTKQNVLLNNVGLRFNITKGQFEVVSSLNPKIVKRINLNGDVFVYTGYMNKNGEAKETYFQLLSEGNTHLLLRRSVFRKQGKKGLYGYSPYEIVQETYYIQKGDKPAVQVKRNKKSILSVLSDEEDLLLKWLHDNDINFYNINDVGKLLKYYDRLKEYRTATDK